MVQAKVTRFRSDLLIVCHFQRRPDTPTGELRVPWTNHLPTMAKNPLLVLSSALIVGLWAGAQVVTIPYVVNLLVLVTAILYVACHSSLILREEQALSRGELPPGDDGTSSDSVPAPPSETLRKEGGCLCMKVHIHVIVIGGSCAGFCCWCYILLQRFTHRNCWFRLYGRQLFISIYCTLFLRTSHLVILLSFVSNIWQRIAQSMMHIVKRRNAVSPAGLGISVLPLSGVQVL